MWTALEQLGGAAAHIGRLHAAARTVSTYSAAASAPVNARAAP
jgi:hypothetical protein